MVGATLHFFMAILLLLTYLIASQLFEPVQALIGCLVVWVIFVLVHMGNPRVRDILMLRKP